MGQAQLESNVWCPHTRAWMPETGYPRMQQAPSFAARSSIGKTPLATTNPFLQLTVLGRRLSERPGADVDGGEDGEDQENQEAGCCRDRSEELQLHRNLPQRSLPPPWLAGRRRAPRCHGNHPPRNSTFMMGDSARADTAPTLGQRAALPPRPHHPRRKSRNQTTVRSANCKRVARSRPLGAPRGGRWVTGPPAPTPRRSGASPARGATRVAERPSRRCPAPLTPSDAAGGGSAPRPPADGGRQRASVGVSAEPPHREAAFIFSPLSHALAGEGGST